MRDYGFQFVETERYKTPGNYIYTRYFRFAKKNGEFVIEEDENPKSKYRFRNIHNYEMPNYDKQQLINRSQEAVENIETGEILASYTHLTFGGGWAERFLAMFSDAGPGNVAWCSTEPFLNKPYVDNIQLLITSSLKP